MRSMILSCASCLVLSAIAPSLRAAEPKEVVLNAPFVQHDLIGFNAFEAICYRSLDRDLWV